MKNLEYARKRTSTEKGRGIVGWNNRKRSVAKDSSGTLSKPLARDTELVIEELGDELLVYDQTNELAHSLGAAAARVWRACDGERSAKALSAELDMDADTVARALEELNECNLLDHGQQLTGMTRREATLKTAKVGGVAATAPLIFSILAPVPAMAATQQYCLALGCTQGCGLCHQAGCACCGPGGNEDKICVQDCSSPFCNEALIKSRCTPTFQGNPPCNTSDARLKRAVRPLAVPLDWLG
jgi:hypothetical protein